MRTKLDFKKAYVDSKYTIIEALSKVEEDYDILYDDYVHAKTMLEKTTETLNKAKVQLKQAQMELRDMEQIKAENRAAKDLKSALTRLGLSVKVQGSM